MNEINLKFRYNPARASGGRSSAGHWVSDKGQRVRQSLQRRSEAGVVRCQRSGASGCFGHARSVKSRLQSGAMYIGSWIYALDLSVDL